MKPADLKTEYTAPQRFGLRSAFTWRPLASLTPSSVADLLRRAAMGDGHDFLIAADDIREKDLHYRAVLQTRALAVAGLPVELAPADDSRAAKKAADLAQAALARLDLAALLDHLMDGVAKGYAVAEILWDTSGAAWLPAAVLPREAHWFTFDRTTGAELRLVDGSPDGQALPPYKMVFHAPGLSGGIPLTGGVARSALWAWVFKSYALRDWASFAELYGQPIRLGRYGLEATPEDIATLKSAVFGIGSDAAAVLPQGMALEIVESASKTASAELYARLIDYLDQQVSKAVLGQTMTTDSGSSRAQAQVHDEVRADLLRADARAIAATLTRDLITPLIRLNLGDAAPLPVLTLRVDEPEDMAALAAQVKQLSAAGLPIPQGWVRAKWGIPEPKAGEAVLGVAPSNPAQPGSPGPDQAGMRTLQATHAPGCGCAAHGDADAAGPPQGGGSPLGGQRANASVGATSPPPLATDLQTERMALEAAPAWTDIMDALRPIVESADSLPALRDALLGAFGALPTDKLSEVMAMGFAAADLAGRFDAHTDSQGADDA